MLLKINSILVILLLFIIPTLGYVLINSIIKEFNFVKVKDKFYMELSEKLKETNLGYFNKIRIEKFLKKNGNPINLTAEKFILLKFLLSIVTLFSLGKEFSILIGVFSAIFMFFLLDLTIILSNKSQDTDIVIGLSDVCDSLRIQLKGGVHITNALTECYLLTKNKRLKRAFQIVETKLYMEHDLEEALLEFREMFNNKYVDAFVITILQSEKSGKINQAMTDLAEAFKDVSDVLDNKRERAISTKIGLIVIGLVIWVLGGSGYAMIMYLIQQSKNMWR